MSELVSIIVPIYNVEKYLDRCLKSIQIQSYQNIQVIMVDDGSTDNSARIAQKYAESDPRFILVHKSNGGLSSARNYGMKYAQGMFVSFIDSDDFISCEYIGYLLRAFDSETDVCVSDYAIYDIKKKCAFYHAGKIENKTFATIEEKIFLVEELMNPGSMIMPVWKNMYRTSFLRERDLSFVSERQVYAEDKLYNIQAYSYARKVKTIEKILYYHLVVPGSLSQGYRSNIFDMSKQLHKRITTFLRETYGNDVADRYDGNYEGILSSSIYVLCKCKWSQACKNIERLLLEDEARQALNGHAKNVKMARYKVLFRIAQTRSVWLIVMMSKTMLLLSPIYRKFQKKRPYITTDDKVISEIGD